MPTTVSVSSGHVLIGASNCLSCVVFFWLFIPGHLHIEIYTSLLLIISLSFSFILQLGHYINYLKCIHIDVYIYSEFHSRIVKEVLQNIYHKKEVLDQIR